VYLQSADWYNDIEGVYYTPPPQIIPKGSTLPLPPAPKRLGYEFIGWHHRYTDGNGNEYGDAEFDFSTKLSSDKTLYATWRQLKAGIVFDSMGGTRITSYIILQGHKAWKPEDPKLKGYIFAGWYTAPTDGKKFPFTTKIYSNLTLYAHWTFDYPIDKLPTKHSNYKKKFKDINKLNSSRKSAVQDMYKYGITEGSGNKDTYKPTDNVNRGAMAQFMYKLRGQKKTTKSIPKLKDVTTLTDDREKAIKWLASEKITVIPKSGKYNPKNIVNRGSMAEFLYKLAGSPPYTPSKQDLARVKDINKIKKNESRKKAVAWLVKNDISVLDNKGNFNPQNTVNRGSMAEFMMKLYKLCVK
jgi:uncharacterized repeat protein (TIGR02543 family)